VFAVLVALCPTASVAQFQGTPQEQAACRPDVLKHCKELIDPNMPNTFSILACLQAKITPAAPSPAVSPTRAACG
jgi:hypothetical protein